MKIPQIDLFHPIQYFRTILFSKRKLNNINQFLATTFVIPQLLLLLLGFTIQGSLIALLNLNKETNYILMINVDN